MEFVGPMAVLQAWTPAEQQRLELVWQQALSPRELRAFAVSRSAPSPRPQLTHKVPRISTSNEFAYRTNALRNLHGRAGVGSKIETETRFGSIKTNRANLLNPFSALYRMLRTVTRLRAISCELGAPKRASSNRFASTLPRRTGAPPKALRPQHRARSSAASPRSAS